MTFEIISRDHQQKNGQHSVRSLNALLIKVRSVQYQECLAGKREAQAVGVLPGHTVIRDVGTHGAQLLRQSGFLRERCKQDSQTIQTTRPAHDIVN